MDIILEFIVGLIGDFIVEGSKASWIPKPLRILLLILFFGIYLGVVGLCILLAVKGSNIAVKILFASLAIVFIIFLVWRVKIFLK